MKNSIIGAICALALSTTAVQAEDNTVSGPYIDLGYNILNLDSERKVADDNDLYFGLGYQLNDHWSASVYYSQLTSEMTNHSGIQDDIDFFQADMVYRTFVRPKSAFFGKFGASYIDTNTMGTGSGVGVIAGGGFEQTLSRQLSVLIGVDFSYQLNDKYFDNIPYVGLRYYFSAPSKAKAPVAVVEAPKDSDNDGVYDNADQCPNSAANIRVNQQGCELDSDNDGVKNSLDKCPNTPAGAKVDDKGCRLYLTKQIAIDLNVQFENNSSQIKSDYQGKIQQVAKFMTQYPDTQAVIEGYTDSTGDANYNQFLSHKRAYKVMQVLISKYSIAANRLKAIGKGETAPIADNKTKAGRAINRRVTAAIKATVKKAQ